MIQHVFSIFNDKVFREVVSITSYIFLSLETQNTKVWNGIIKFSEQKFYIFLVCNHFGNFMLQSRIYFWISFKCQNLSKWLTSDCEFMSFEKFLLSWLENFSSQIKVTNGFWYQFLWPFLFFEKENEDAFNMILIH